MFSRVLVLVAAAALASASGSTLFALDAKTPGARTAILDGYQGSPPISTPGTGTFTIAPGPGGQSMEYKLTYSNLEGTAVLSHIHFATPGVTGGILVFLCGGGGKPDCPPTGTISGTILPQDVQPLTAQGVGAGDFDKVVQAILASATYVNVHTSRYIGGEIRGNLK